MRPNGAIATMGYDSADRLVPTVDPFGVQASWAYDVQGRFEGFASSAGDGLALAYGDGVYAPRVMRAGILTTQVEHDAFGQSTRLVFPDGTSEERGYDRLGRLIFVRDAQGNGHGVAYDLEGRIVEVGFPDGTLRRLQYGWSRS